MRILGTLLHEGQINLAAFEAAVRAGLPVGSCACGGLLAGAVDRGRALTWVTLRCRRCGSERVAPEGRLLPAGRAGRPPPDRHLLEAAAEIEDRRFGERDA